MRSSLCIATGLLALNVALFDRGPAPSAPRVEPPLPTLEIFDATVMFDSAVSGDALLLENLWRAAHPGEPLPGCHIRDPIATLDLDFDPTPGREHIIGNRQFGVAMYAETGELLARMEPVQCFGYTVDSDQSLSLGTISNRLVVRTRMIARGGEYLDAHIAERRGDVFVELATLDIGGDRHYREGHWDVEGAIYLSGDTLEMK